MLSIVEHVQEYGDGSADYTAADTDGSGEIDGSDPITADEPDEVVDFDDDAHHKPDAPTEPTGITPPLRVQEVIAATCDNPDRTRYSSTDSVCMSHEKPGDYRHNLWLPRQLPGQPEQPGLLRATAYLNREGFATNSGSVMDRYHYRTASGVANFAYHGFTPVLQAIGMDVSCRVRSVYHDRQCQVDVAFSSAERTAELCNDLLERSGENLRLVVLPPGRYDSATFINLMAGRRYPLSQEYATHDQESGVLEPGSHDVLQHVPVIMALAGTQALGRVQERAQALVDGSALGNYQGEADRQRLRKQFMGEVDGTLNGIIMSEVLQGDPEAKRKFARVLGLYSTDSVDPYLEEVLDNIRRPEVTGRLVLPS